MTWWEALIVALALYALAAWNLTAWLQRRRRERRAEQLRRDLGLDGPGEGRKR